MPVYAFRSAIKINVCLLVIGVAIQGHAQPAFSDDRVQLLPGAPIFVSANEPEPVRRAVQDLQRDLRNVLGSDSPVKASLDEAQGGGIVIAGTAPDFATLRDKTVSGREAHAVFTRGRFVVLQGADVRGTIYAIYTFSEHFLGIPPLWLWASWTPARKAAIEIPAGTKLWFPSPYVRWRAWFPNDEDLLTPWRARSQENYEAFLETMLRLKINTLEGEMMDKDSFDRPYQVGRQFRLARDRGLAVTGHHMRIFGSNYENWDLYWRKIRKEEPPKLAISNVEALEEFWRYHIETGKREKLEMIWLIGFRGDRDIPFWETFADAPSTDAERAHVIQEMMDREVALLKKTTGDSFPPMRVTLYNENSDFFAQGLLHPPTEPNLIWAFVAARRDHFPAADIRGYSNDAQRPLGYYFNFQFTSTGAHLAAAEGPWKMEKNFRMANAISGRPLEFSVVNAGNIREFVLELSANARMMWDFDGYTTDKFLLDFCAEYFGAENAEKVAKVYRDFYNSYWTQKKPDIPGFDRQFLFQDMRYARAIEQIVSQIPKGRDLNPLKDSAMDSGGRYFRIVPQDDGATNQIEAIMNGTTRSIAKLTAVVAEADACFKSTPPEKRDFFNDNLRVQARFLLDLNRTLQSTARAMDFLPDRNKAATALKDAERSALSMRDDLRRAEHEPFAGWYEGDHLFGVMRIQQRIDTAFREINP